MPVKDTLSHINTAVISDTVAIKNQFDLGSNHIFKDSPALVHKLTASASHPYFSNIWVTVLMLLTFIMITNIWYFYYSKVSAVAKAFVSIQAANQLLREEYTLTRRVSLLLLAIFLLNGSYFIYRLSLASSFINLVYMYTFANYLFIILVLVLVYTVKILMQYAFGFITKLGDLAYQSVFNIMLSLKSIGLILFPINLLLAYSHISTQILLGFGVTLTVIVFCIRYYKFFVLGFQNRAISIFHFLLYLCTVEILPTLTIVKFIIAN